MIEKWARQKLWLKSSLVSKQRRRVEEAELRLD
jgi:hypothetical protein